MQQICVGGDVLHRHSIVNVPDKSLSINDATQGHTAKLEQVNLLTIQACHPMIGIGQANEWQALILPITLEDYGIARPDCNDFSPA